MTREATAAPPADPASAGFRDNVRRWGWPRAVHMGVMRWLGRRLGLHVAWINTRTMDPDVTVPEPPPGYSVRRLTDADYQAAMGNPELDLDEDFVTAARRQGHFCVGAFHHQDLVSYVWRAFSPTAINARYTLIFDEPNRYGYKAMTLPAHRGKHLQNVISLFSDRLCHELGRSEAVAFIETHNYPSLRSDARRGNRHVGWIVWLDRGPRLCFASPGARRTGVDIKRSDRLGAKAARGSG